MTDSDQSCVDDAGGNLSGRVVVHECMLRNEFAEVRLRVIHTRNGRRLEIFSPRGGSRCAFDPVGLEVLSRLQPAHVCRLLEESYEERDGEKHS